MEHAKNRWQWLRDFFWRLKNETVLRVGKDKTKNVFSYLASFIVITIVYGAIPFVSIPDLLQITWASGFAESFVNAGWPAIKAINFGLPIQAPMAFGAIGAFIQSFFIWLFHFNAPDAYSFMSLVLLALALWGAIKLCEVLGTSFFIGSFLSLIYLTLPVVWWHAGYSILSFGFALLPLYVYASFRIIYFPKLTYLGHFSMRILLQLIGFIFVSVLAVFIDGYTFVMFFSAAALIWIIAFFRKETPRKILFTYSLPVILFSASISYFLYTKYIGVSSFSIMPLSFFRGWGIDLVMLFAPTKGVLWLWDLLRLSQNRSAIQFFGDASVWSTTFALPLILVGATGLFLSRKNRFALPLLLIAVLGFYFSLGPSLKINSLRPVDNNGNALVQGVLMPENLAVMPTGNAFISEHIPGFQNMRASYRWTGLMFVGLFGLSGLFFHSLFSRGGKFKLLAILIVLFLIVSNLPNIPKRISSSINNRSSMLLMDSDLIKNMKETIGPGKTVFFAPPGNDFAVTYLSAMGKFSTYNIGGDKNVQIARQNWPKPLLDFKQYEPGECFTQDIETTLRSGIADVVVLTYFDTLSNINNWPPKKTIISAKRSEFASTIAYFSNAPMFKVDDEKYYAAISLSQNSTNNEQTSDGGPILNLDQIYAVSNMDCEHLLLFGSGWYQSEGDHIWSSRESTISFTIPKLCTQGSACDLVLTTDVFNASSVNPQEVIMEVNGKPINSFMITSGGKMVIPLNNLQGDQTKVYLNIIVPNATSPSIIGQSTDDRILGLNLIDLELIKETENK